MPRIRSIKPEFFTSKSNAALSYRCRLTFIGLLTYVDDHGRGLDDPRIIKGAIWPQDDDVTFDDIAVDLTALNVAEKLVRYEKQGLKLLVIHNWHKHQRVSHPSKSKYPAPPRGSRKSPEVLRLPLETRAPEVEVGSGSRKGKGSGAGKGSPRGNPKPKSGVQAHDVNPEPKPKPSAKEGLGSYSAQERHRLAHVLQDNPDPEHCALCRKNLAVGT
jgi:hypothetical protein